MCGIYGEFSFRGPLDIRGSIRNLHQLAHRGPDGYGYEFGNRGEGACCLQHNSEAEDERFRTLSARSDYFLGHRRLSINDLSELASQPMESWNRRYSIVFNGEIYNFIELKQSLLREDVRFLTDHSDTEALLNAFAVWGPACLERLDGMFAFAIYDREARRIFMARDRIGEKPLYYEFTEDRFRFSSELGPMVRFEPCKREIDPVSLAYYLALGYVLHPRSIYRGISKLPPATCALVDLERRSISLERYWDVPYSGESRDSERILTERVEQALTDSVSMRLRADVPVGAFLSGGTDSTLVVKKIREIRGEGTDVFGADFPGTPHSELPHILEGAARYGHRANIVPISMEQSRHIESVVSVFDEPFDGGSAVAAYELFREAGKRYKVILTGDGGDEFFAGYPRYREFAGRYNLAAAFAGIPGAGPILRIASRNLPAKHKLRRLSEYIRDDRVTSYLTSKTRFDLLRYMTDGDGEEYGRRIVEEISAAYDRPGMPAIKSLQYLETKTILPGRMLYKVDRFSMSNGVEARTPFLDHNLVELAFSVPSSMNVSRRGAKRILKNILMRDFESTYVHRKKQGFGNPLSVWFRESGPGALCRVLSDPCDELRGFIRTDLLAKDIDHGHFPNRPAEIWRMVVLLLFLRQNRESIRA